MNHNIHQIKPIHINTILGYEVYVPDVYFNPYGLRKTGCPLWIRINEDGDCLVHIIANGDKWMEEAINVISSLPQKQGIAFYPLTDDVIHQHNINTQDFYSISSVAKNENGEIQAIIVIDRDTEDKNAMIVSFIYYTDILILQQLRNHILADYNTDRFKGFVLKYRPSNGEDLTQVLGLLKDDEHDYSYLQLL